MGYRLLGLTLRLFFIKNSRYSLTLTLTLTWLDLFFLFLLQRFDVVVYGVTVYGTWLSLCVAIDCIKPFGEVTVGWTTDR